MQQNNPPGNHDDNENTPSIFDMNPAQFAAFIAPATEALLVQTHREGLYHTYPGPQANTFIHEYAGGRKILIEIDTQTGKEHFLKNL